jgi:hypothetical protein
MSGKLLLVGWVMGAVATLGMAQDDLTKNLAKVRLAEARKGLALAENPVLGGSESCTNVWIWSNRVLDAELYLSTTQDERIAAFEAHLRRMVKLQGITKALFERRMISEAEVMEAAYQRIDAEVRLTEAIATKASARK